MVLIRTDANDRVGMGHIMRCLSIADAFSSINEEVEFIISDNKYSQIVKKRGFRAIVLNSDYSKMDNEPDWWNKISSNIIIVDSYFVTPSFLTVLHNKTKATGTKLVYIDDILSFSYPVDIVVNYNAYSSEENYRSLYSGNNFDNPVFVIGPSYAPIRTMFRGLEKKKQNLNVHDVLISTGGSDELHLALYLVNYLVNNQVDRKYTFHFLIGTLNADKRKICSLAQRNTKIVLHESVSDMKSLISNMDIVISAAGSTLYEVCSCGVPLITYSLADNQIRGTEAFERLGLSVNIGDLRDLRKVNKLNTISGKLKKNTVTLLFSELDRLASNYELRIQMGTKMQNLVDGFGADRLVRRIISEKG